MKPLTGLVIGIISAVLTIGVAILLCAISGRSFVAALGFSLTWPLFAILVLTGWLATIIRER